MVNDEVADDQERGRSRVEAAEEAEEAPTKKRERGQRGGKKRLETKAERQRNYKIQKTLQATGDRWAMEQFQELVRGKEEEKKAKLAAEAEKELEKKAKLAAEAEKQLAEKILAEKNQELATFEAAAGLQNHGSRSPGPHHVRTNVVENVLVIFVMFKVLVVVSFGLRACALQLLLHVRCACALQLLACLVRLRAMVVSRNCFVNCLAVRLRWNRNCFVTFLLLDLSPRFQVVPRSKNHFPTGELAEAQELSCRHRQSHNWLHPDSRKLVNVNVMPIQLLMRNERARRLLPHLGEMKKVLYQDLGEFGGKLL